MAKRKQDQIVKIPADIVWGAACAAQRLNGRWIRTREYDSETQKSYQANKEIMREIMLNTPELITDQDREQAKLVRTYWRNKLMEVLAGSANSFTKQAVEVAGQEEFIHTEFFAFGTIAYLPEGYNRGMFRDAVNMAKSEALIRSNHFGRIGEKVSGKAIVIECRYSEKWTTHYITAKFGDNVILFSFRNRLENNQEIILSGTIKSHRDEGLTQLNRVRIMHV